MLNAFIKIHHLSIIEQNKKLIHLKGITEIYISFFFLRISFFFLMVYFQTRMSQFQINVEVKTNMCFKALSNKRRKKKRIPM